MDSSIVRVRLLLDVIRPSEKAPLASLRHAEDLTALGNDEVKAGFEQI